MEARNRKLSDWYGKVQRAEIKLPRFQLMEARDRVRIASLVETVNNNLPLGITLILAVGDEEQFISRHLATAPGERGLNRNERKEHKEGKMKVGRLGVNRSGLLLFAFSAFFAVHPFGKGGAEMSLLRWGL